MQTPIHPIAQLGAFFTCRSGGGLRFGRTDSRILSSRGAVLLPGGASPQKHERGEDPKTLAPPGCLTAYCTLRRGIARDRMPATSRSPPAPRRMPSTSPPVAANAAARVGACKGADASDGEIGSAAVPDAGGGPASGVDPSPGWGPGAEVVRMLTATGVLTLPTRSVLGCTAMLSSAERREADAGATPTPTPTPTDAATRTTLTRRAGTAGEVTRGRRARKLAEVMRVLRGVIAMMSRAPAQNSRSDGSAGG